MWRRSTASTLMPMSSHAPGRIYFYFSKIISTNTYRIDGGCTSTCSEPVLVEDCKECETAWMYLSDKCITEYLGSKNWGWYNTYSAEQLKAGVTAVVIAGAGGCDPDKGYKLGEATVTLSQDGKTLDVNLADIIPTDCEMTGIHIWASNDVIPSRGCFSKWYKTDTVTFKKPLTGTVYLAVHSTVCCSVCPNEGVCTYS